MVFHSTVIATIVDINKAIDVGDSQMTCKALQNPAAHITNLDENNQDKYQTSLATQKSNKADVRDLTIAIEYTFFLKKSVH